MKNNSFSQQLNDCEYMRSLAGVGGYLASDKRTEFTDKAIERYLTIKGLGPNAIVFMLLSKVGKSLMAEVTSSTSTAQFIELLKKHFPNPMTVLTGLLNDSGVSYTIAEAGMLKYLRAKGIIKEKSEIFNHTTDGHSKFWNARPLGGGDWEITYGRIGKEESPQGTKIYNTEEYEKLKREKLLKGYRRIS